MVSLEKKLEKERAAIVKAEKNAKDDQKKSKEENRELRGLEERLINRIPPPAPGCNIL